MEVKIRNLPKFQVELKIELSAEEFKQFIEKAALNLGKDLELKGFRKGKVPKEIIEKEIGSEKILIEAADLAVRGNYIKAIIENKIEAVSQPKIEIQKLARGDSFIFLAKTAVLPEVKLPDYKKIASKIERKKIVVEENEVKEALKWLQRSRAKLTLKNQPAEIGDFVEIEYWLPKTLEFTKQKGQKDAFILGEGHFIPGFEEKLLGMKAGEEKGEISIGFPEKHPLRKTAGEKLTLKVKMKSVQNIEFPDINDEFAKSLPCTIFQSSGLRKENIQKKVQGLGKFENLTDLEKNIKEGINLEKEQAESQRVRGEILEKVAQATECEIPDILIEQEKKQILENLKKNVSENLKISFNDYLNKIKKTEKEILNSFLSEARKRVKNYLVLREIGKREKVEASEEEIKEETNKILNHYSNIKGAEKELARQNFSSKNLGGLDLENLKEYTKEAIRNEKIFQLLENLTLNKQ